MYCYAYSTCFHSYLFRQDDFLQFLNYPNGDPHTCTFTELQYNVGVLKLEYRGGC